MAQTSDYFLNSDFSFTRISCSFSTDSSKAALPPKNQERHGRKPLPAQGEPCQISGLGSSCSALNPEAKTFAVCRVGSTSCRKPCSKPMVWNFHGSTVQLPAMWINCSESPLGKNTIDGSICSNKPFSNGIREKALNSLESETWPCGGWWGLRGSTRLQQEAMPEARTPLMAHTTASSHERLSFAKQVAIGWFHWHH